MTIPRDLDGETGVRIRTAQALNRVADFIESVAMSIDDNVSACSSARALTLSVVELECLTRELDMYSLLKDGTYKIPEKDKS